MRRRSPFTIVLALACGALVVAAASCGNPLSLAGDPDATVDGNVGVGVPDGSSGDAAVEGAVTPTCMADLAVDPLNCGACGHKCERDVCAAGLCDPVRATTPTDAFFGDGAHIDVHGATGVLTDGWNDVGVLGGTVYVFDAKATPAAPTGVRNGAATPRLAAAGTSQAYWTEYGDTQLHDQANSPVAMVDGGTFVALASSPSGLVIAAAVQPASGDEEVHVYDAPLLERRSFPVTGSANCPGIVFSGDAAVLVASSEGVKRCSIDETTPAPACALVAQSPSPAQHVAVSGQDVFFTTSAGELRHGAPAAAPATTMLMSGLVNARAVAADPKGAYVLDDNGIRTTRYGTPLTLVKPAAGKIFDFALASPWLYFVTATGLYRVTL